MSPPVANYLTHWLYSTTVATRKFNRGRIAKIRVWLNKVSVGSACHWVTHYLNPLIWDSHHSKCNQLLREWTGPGLSNQWCQLTSYHSSTRVYLVQALVLKMLTFNGCRTWVVFAGKCTSFPQERVQSVTTGLTGWYGQEPLSSH